MLQIEAENQYKSRKKREKGGGRGAIYVHFADSIIHRRLRWKTVQLYSGKLQHARLAVLGGDLRADDGELLLGEGGFLFDLDEQLERDGLGGYMTGIGVCVAGTHLLELLMRNVGHCEG